jgi:hypothetical protein
MGDSVDTLCTQVSINALWRDRIKKEEDMTDMTPTPFSLGQ